MEEIKVSVVIPVYNSAMNLDELVHQLELALDNLVFEVILVNDQSKDNSWEVIESILRKNKQIIGINLRKNSGQDNAIFAGLQYAKGKYIVIMDDDLQHSPFDILRLLDQVNKGYDVCYANFEKKQQKKWKNLGSWLNGKVAEFIIDKPKNIYLSPFKIIKKDVVEEILQTSYLYPYIDGIIFTITDNITQVDVKHHERFRGISNYTFFDSIKVFMKLATGFSVLPLRLASLLGLTSSIFGVFLGMYFILEFLLNNDSPEGYTSIIVAILFFGGAILVCIGIIGEYLGRIYLSINKNKSYTIKMDEKDE